MSLNTLMAQRNDPVKLVCVSREMIVFPPISSVQLGLYMIIVLLESAYFYLLLMPEIYLRNYLCDFANEFFCIN